MGVKAEVISTRILSKDDKDDMMAGNLPIDALECAVKCWLNAGEPDYANGSTKPTKRIK